VFYLIYINARATSGVARERGRSWRVAAHPRKGAIHFKLVALAFRPPPLRRWILCPDRTARGRRRLAV